MSLVGSKNINSASTEEKIRTLARKKPELAQFLNQTFQANVEINSSLPTTKAFQSLDRYTRNAIITLFSAELEVENALSQTLTPVSESISNFGNEVNHGIQGVKENLNKLLKPISSATGSTLGNLTNVAKDPLGAPFAIGNSIMNLIDKVNPDFANSLDSSFKKFKVDELANLPGQVVGSIRNLAALADSVLSLPFAIAADLYNGLMEIMQEIADVIDSIISSIFDLFFGPGGVLDSILPIAAVMEFLEAVSELASFVGGISQMFGGFTAITNITSQITSYSSQAIGVLNNPAALALQYVPPQVGQIMGAIRNPEGALQSLIPSSIQNQLKQIQNVPGLGFVGNLGYGLRGTLEELSQGVLTRTFDQYANQLGILGPLLNANSNTPIIHDQQQSYPPSIDPASTNPNIPTIQGVPVQVQQRQPLIEQNKNFQKAIDETNPLNYLITPDPGPFKLSST